MCVVFPREAVHVAVSLPYTAGHLEKSGVVTLHFGSDYVQNQMVTENRTFCRFYNLGR